MGNHMLQLVRVHYRANGGFRGRAQGSLIKPSERGQEFMLVCMRLRERMQGRSQRASLQAHRLQQLIVPLHAAWACLHGVSPISITEVFAAARVVVRMTRLIRYAVGAAHHTPLLFFAVAAATAIAHLSGRVGS